MKAGLELSIGEISEDMMDEENENSKRENDHRTFPKFFLIAAIDEEGGIGKEGTMPWDFKEDMKYFKILTKGAGDNFVVMGRKTFESMYCRPLPMRKNIVITSSEQMQKEHHKPEKNTFILGSIAEAISLIVRTSCDDVWVIGGASIYNEFLTNHTDLVDSIYLTHISDSYECDVHFPCIPSNYTLARSHQILEKETLLKFKVYTR